MNKCRECKSCIGLAIARGRFVCTRTDAFIYLHEPNTKNRNVRPVDPERNACQYFEKAQMVEWHTRTA